MMLIIAMVTNNSIMVNPELVFDFTQQIPVISTLLLASVLYESGQFLKFLQHKRYRYLALELVYILNRHIMPLPPGAGPIRFEC